MSPENQLIARLATVFKEPQCDDPDAYVAEFRKAIKGYAADVLEAAGDEVMKRCTFWPRPAEVIGIIEEICRRREAAKPPPPAPRELPPPTPEQVARSRKILAAAVAAMRAGAPKAIQSAPLPPMQRPQFEAMQRASRNTHLHVDQSLARRTTGERE